MDVKQFFVRFEEKFKNDMNAEFTSIIKEINDSTDKILSAAIHTAESMENLVGKNIEQMSEFLETFETLNNTKDPPNITSLNSMSDSCQIGVSFTKKPPMNALKSERNKVIMEEINTMENNDNNEEEETNESLPDDEEMESFMESMPMSNNVDQQASLINNILDENTGQQPTLQDNENDPFAEENRQKPYITSYNQPPGNMMFISKDNKLVRKYNTSGRSDRSTMSFRCKECTYTSKYEHNLLRHVKGQHSKIKDLICQKCDYSTYDRGNLKKHSERCQIGEHDISSHISYR